MKLLEKIRSIIIEKSPDQQKIEVQEYLDEKALGFINRVWYEGKEYKLEELYKCLSYPTSESLFWKARPSKNNRIRKLHTGLPKLIVDVITRIVIRDMNDVDVRNSGEKVSWKAISDDNDFKKIVKEAIKNTLIMGSGAFRTIVDMDVSEYPIIEYWPGNKIEVSYKHNRMQSISFNSSFVDNGKQYEHKQIYGYGYIRNELYLHGELVDLSFTNETMGVNDFTFDNSVILAVPISFNDGSSIYSGKQGNFDALDEIWSQWMDALRSGRTKTYIPEDIIPRDPDNGRHLKPNSYDNQYFKIESDKSENGTNKIEVTDPDIKSDKYLQTYITALDLCLQGIISPSTLGIDVKKLDNAEAQREKEKATLYTRNDIIEVLQNVIPKVVKMSLNCLSLMQNETINIDTEVKVEFGEYANPSFESQVETISKAKTGGIMSVEVCVDELYGDTKDEIWKEEEITRLKEEQGIIEIDDPNNPDTKMIEEESI